MEKKFNYYSVSAIIFVVTIIVSLCNDLGKSQPAYMITWDLPVEGFMLFTSMYLLGYSAAKRELENK